MKIILLLMLACDYALAAILRGLPLVGSIDALIFFEPLTANYNLNGQSRGAKRRFIADKMEKHRQTKQARVEKFLQRNDITYKAFWIANVISAEDIDVVDLILLSTLFPEVEKITNNYVAGNIEAPTEFGERTVRSVSHILEWNINKIHAPDVWNTIGTGEGVVVANVDSGVRFTHEQLLENYRGNVYNNGTYNHDYNWWDPRGVSQIPYDNNGHGTHSMATIAGMYGTGVAPGAKWITAKGCASTSCFILDLIEAGQYVMCPTKQDGSGEDCDLGADVVSNSWGSGQGDSSYSVVIDAWRAADMIPVFSAGNSGPNCGTVVSPGDLDTVIAVGSVDRNDRLSAFSSRGPGSNSAHFPLQKPDIVAPGEIIQSAGNASNTAYITYSGTSMAAPHVAGVVALLLGVNASLTFDDIYTILITSKNSTMGVPKSGLTTCGGVPYTTYPNYHYGYGRVDALAAANLV